MSGTDAVDYNSELIEAARQKDVTAALVALQCGADIDAKDHEGNTALHRAIGNSDLEMTIELLKAGATADIPNDYDYTPLITAARRGDIDIMEKLIQYNADPDWANDNGLTPLMGAAHYDKAEACHLIMKHSQHSVDRQTKRGMTACMDAVISGQTNALEALMQYGPDLNNPADSENRTAAQLASYFDHLDAYTLIVKYNKGIEERKVAKEQKAQAEKDLITRNHARKQRQANLRNYRRGMGR